jgi:hypothetical protein
MVETLDVHRLAGEIVNFVEKTPSRVLSVDTVTEYLRVCWNARGAADIAKVGVLTPAVAGVLVPALKNLDH